jgi:hypothetical protein
LVVWVARVSSVSRAMVVTVLVGDGQDAGSFVGGCDVEGWR